MAENLNYNSENSFCYDELKSNCDKYGRLYIWEIAKNVCPDGWHLPSDREWKILEINLGMSQLKIEKDLQFLFHQNRKMSLLRNSNALMKELKLKINRQCTTHGSIWAYNVETNGKHYLQTTSFTTL